VLEQERQDRQVLRNQHKNSKSVIRMKTNAHIQDTPENVRSNSNYHTGQVADDPAVLNNLNEYATMMRLQRSYLLVNEHISQTGGNGWIPRNDLKESGQDEEARNILMQNKNNVCLPGSGSTPQSEARRAPQKRRRKRDSTPNAHDYGSIISTLLQTSNAHYIPPVADMTMAPSSVPSLHLSMENKRKYKNQIQILLWN
jgi:hypothetical protein